MGFDMYIIKAKKKTVDEILNKYYQNDLNDLPYDAFVELEDHVDSKSFVSRVNILNNLNGLPYANDKYTYLSKEHYELMLAYCEERQFYLKQYQTINFSNKKMEYIECERLTNWLKELNPDWETDILIYEYDC